jgi:hypothetical protein
VSTVMPEEKSTLSRSMMTMSRMARATSMGGAG